MATASARRSGRREGLLEERGGEFPPTPALIFAGREAVGGVLRAQKDGWLHCHDLAAMRVRLWKLREADPNYPVEQDLRYKLAVLGQLRV